MADKNRRTIMPPQNRSVGDPAFKTTDYVPKSWRALAIGERKIAIGKRIMLIKVTG